MEVKKAKYETIGKGVQRQYSVLVEFDDDMPKGRIVTEDLGKHLTRIDDDVGHGIYVGRDLEPVLPVIHAEAANIDVRGFTEHPDVIAIARRFFDDVENGRYEDGRVVWPPEG